MNPQISTDNKPSIFCAFLSYPKGGTSHESIKVCCLVIVIGMLLFGLPGMPCASEDQIAQLSQEEL